MSPSLAPSSSHPPRPRSVAFEPRFARRAVPVVVMQHIEESAHLRHVRSVLVRAPHVRLLQLGRLDERIAAHLDGVAVAGDDAVPLVRQALARPGVGEVFVATVRAIEDRDDDRLDALLAVAEAEPACRAGLLSAFGWVSASALRDLMPALLASSAAGRRAAGLAACEMHGVDPGSLLDAALLRDEDARLRARALRVAGRCGRRDLAPACINALNDDDPRCAFEAARSALYLGDRADAVAALEALAGVPATPDRLRHAALRTVLKVLASARAQPLLASLAADPTGIRALLRGIGHAGDPRYVPWLISKMDDLQLARLAGEAFSFITGLDLAYLDLDRKPPQDREFGPNDDPADGDVALDEDDSLPWPDPARIAAWWKTHGARYTPGTRYFMGEVPSPAKCLEVLETGFQRQRIAAAQYRVLFAPGTPLFNTAAPAWRQKRWLAALGAPGRA